jgi:hypothetical protein
MNKSLRFALVLSIAALFADQSRADLTTPQTVSVNLQNTNWSNSLVFNKFDSSLGTLNSISLSLSGHVSGTAWAENTSAASSTVNLVIQSIVTLSRSDTTQIITAAPVAASTDNLAAFDGLQNFAGADFVKHTDLNADNTTLTSLNTAADLALFTGNGLITLPISAGANSFASGPGGLISSFTTLASASATIVYNYTAARVLHDPSPVPEPASIVLTACGGIGLMFVMHRRQKSKKIAS